MNFDGILLVDKPKGWSSFDVVAKVRGTLRTELRTLHERRGFCMEMRGKDGASSGANRTGTYGERATKLPDAAMRSKESGVVRPTNEQAFRCKCRVKVGHTGTLDPLATGLMVIVAGSYCKRAGEFSKLDKTYEVTMKLGETSSTGDEEGEKTKVEDRIVEPQELTDVLLSFVGKSMQTPPAYSAIKINGQRAYKLARAGKEVVIEPRQIEIYEIAKISYIYPHVTFTTSVSSGTYIRSLVEDIGKKLGTGAYMSDLRRTKVGIFKIQDAIMVEDVSYSSIITLQK